jgi:3-oxoacyl-[acyl-carrier-protein] synthase II
MLGAARGRKATELTAMSLNGRRRVVITGLGAVTPLGNDPESTWETLVAGRSGAGEITQFDSSDYAVHFACEVKGFDPTQYIDRKQARRMDRFAHLIVAAARQAEADAALSIESEPDRIGAAIATGIGGLRAFQDCYDELLQRGPDRVNPFSIPEIIPNMGAAWVSMQLGTQGPLSSQCTACAASNMAIGDGLDAIRLGRADVMLCGGTEAPVTSIGIAGFGAMRALSRRNSAPEQASRPFDADRDGFVMGEAGAILVLEDLEHARRRDAKIYAELYGYGVSSDAQHITEPDPSGRSPARAMHMAFADAGIAPGDLDYINAHGTSTPLGDASETRVLKLALGEDVARAMPISSTKGATGHCLGASGAVEAIFSTLAIRDGILPPTINYDTPDPECDLDYIANESREADVEITASNSFGFGGHNATIVLRRFTG